MTERQAWLTLAKVWENARKMHQIVISELGDGLCVCLESLHLTGKIDDKIQASMFEKIRKMNQLPGSVYLYKWPHTVKGAKQRALFCRKQAALLAPKKRKKKAKKS